MSTAGVVLVGGGPRTLSVLERLSSNLPVLAPHLSLDVHVVDPYPAGKGRVWRSEQSHLLWMNSTAADTTVFTDDSVTCDGPIRRGPSLAEWAVGVGRERLRELGHGGDLQPGDFPARRVQAAYLQWVWESVLASLPPQVRVREHAESAVAVDEVRRGGRRVCQRVTLASGRQLDADLVVLAQGYLDHEPTAEQRDWLSASATRGLTYLPPGYTAEEQINANAFATIAGPQLRRAVPYVGLVVVLGAGAIAWRRRRRRAAPR